MPSVPFISIGFFSTCGMWAGFQLHFAELSFKAFLHHHGIQEPIYNGDTVAVVGYARGPPRRHRHRLVHKPEEVTVP